MVGRLLTSLAKARAPWSAVVHQSQPWRGSFSWCVGFVYRAGRHFFIVLRKVTLTTPAAKDVVVETKSHRDAWSLVRTTRGLRFQHEALKKSKPTANTAEAA